MDLNNPIYNGDYSDEVAKEFIAGMSSPDQARYAIQIDGDFGFPPIRDATRFMNDRVANNLSEDLEDVIVHECVMGKKVTVSLDGTVIGAFISNSMTDSWDAVAPFFSEHPTAFNVLRNAALFSVIKKFTPRLKSTPRTPEAKSPKSLKSPKS